MYLLNQQISLEWELLATTDVPDITDLDLITIDPFGNSTYEDAPFLPGNYTAPTDTLIGSLVHDFTPGLEGLWKFRLVIGTAASYQVLARSTIMVFDRTAHTSPYNSWIGKTIPYDIQFSMQGFYVANEIMGMYVAGRPIYIDAGADGSTAICEEPPTTEATVTLDILLNEVPVGSVVFTQFDKIGVVNFPVFYLLSPNDKLQLKSTGVIDENLQDVAVNINARVTILEY